MNHLVIRFTSEYGATAGQAAYPIQTKAACAPSARFWVKTPSSDGCRVPMSFRKEIRHYCYDDVPTGDSAAAAATPLNFPV